MNVAYPSTLDTAFMSSMYAFAYFEFVIVHKRKHLHKCMRVSESYIKRIKSNVTTTVTDERVRVCACACIALSDTETARERLNTNGHIDSNTICERIGSTNEEPFE